jgi:multiple sugar transport system ATP-binding protein
MNILPVRRASTTGGFVRVELSSGHEVETRVPASDIPESSSLRLGLRPESVRVFAKDAGQCNAVVEYREYLGDKAHLYLTLPGGEKLVALHAADSGARPGDAVGLAFDGAAAHLFDDTDRAYHAGRAA